MGRRMFSGMLERRRNKGKLEKNQFSYETNPFQDINLDEDELEEDQIEENQIEELIEENEQLNKTSFSEKIVEEIQYNDVEELLKKPLVDFLEEAENDVRQYVPAKQKKQTSLLDERRNDYQKEMQKRVFSYETEIRKKIFIEFVIDKTISFTTVFPKVFYIMETMMRELKYKKTEYRDVEIQYGLTLFNEDVEIKVFSNGEYFTRSEDEFLQALRNIRFSGGSDDGKEDLAGAIAKGMCVLQNAGEESAERGLFFFSDSMPIDDDMFPNFTEEEQDGYWNKGVRFAEFYTYTDKFKPIIWTVNGEGVNDGEGTNEARMYSLKTLLDGDLDEASKKVENTVNRILNQCSVFKSR